MMHAIGQEHVVMQDLARIEMRAPGLEKSDPIRSGSCPREDMDILKLIIVIGCRTGLCETLIKAMMA